MDAAGPYGCAKCGSVDVHVEEDPNLEWLCPAHPQIEPREDWDPVYFQDGPARHRRELFAERRGCANLQQLAELRLRFHVEPNDWHIVSRQELHVDDFECPGAKLVVSIPDLSPARHE